MPGCRTLRSAAIAATRARVAKLEGERRGIFVQRTFTPQQGDDDLERVVAQLKPEVLAMMRLSPCMLWRITPRLVFRG